MNYLDVFKQLSNEIRFRIVALLLEHELCVCAFEEITDLHQAMISKHLNLLKKAGMVESRREKQRIFYFLSDAFRQQDALIETIANYKSKDDTLMDDQLRLAHHLKHKEENVYVCQAFRKENLA